jgi:hypothetical protein
MEQCEIFRFYPLRAKTSFHSLSAQLPMPQRS